MLLLPFGVPITKPIFGMFLRGCLRSRLNELKGFVFRFYGGGKKNVN
jgi:hypothetical protein